jgi:hypothetical protein
MLGVLDHLWQSLLFVALIYGLARLTRNNLAALRLWMWRSAALKFLLPFGLLYAFGAWLGFPVRHSAIPPPTAMAEFAAFGLPLATPAQTFADNAWWLTMGMTLALIAAAACGVAIFRELRTARQQQDAEQQLMAADWRYRATPLGFLRAAVLTGVVILTLFLPIVCGATKDRQWRQQALAIDQRSLHSAMVAMSEAKPGRGFLSKVTANDEGVTIANINIQDLVALVYGIEQFEVFGGALPWLESPRYDVRVTGPVYAPSAFDPYSVRQPVTDYLYQRFGVSIRVNGDCQEPCGSYESFHIERLPRCANPLSSHLCRR